MDTSINPTIGSESAVASSAKDGTDTNTGQSYRDIYKEIRDRICLLQYPPGSLLTENQLATEFGVSRTPIRQALHRLEFEGLVITKRGVGTMVTIVDLRALREVYALRLRLYELIGDFSSSERMHDDDIDTLRSVLKEARRMVGYRNNRSNQVELARLYTTFNQIITHTISNDALRKISEQLFYQTSRVWLQILPDLDWDEEVEYFCKELEQVIEVLENSGDMADVAQIRRSHMVELLNRIRLYLGGINLAELQAT